MTRFDGVGVVPRRVERLHAVRAVLVTGASGGIGAAVAHRFAQAGDRVAVHYSTNRVGAEETLRSLPGDGHALVAGDIGEPDGPLRIVALAIHELGPLDVLVCNAAVAPAASNRHVIGETSYEQWGKAFEQMVGVTSVAPGFVATERQLSKLHGAEGEALRAQSPFGRVGTPQEIASAVFWLASPEAAWSSGAILDANGASYLRS